MDIALNSLQESTCVLVATIQRDCRSCNALIVSSTYASSGSKTVGRLLSLGSLALHSSHVSMGFFTTMAFADYGMEVHPEKTRLVRFKRPSKYTRNEELKPESFEFLGHFTARQQRGASAKQARSVSRDRSKRSNSQRIHNLRNHVCALIGAS